MRVSLAVAVFLLVSSSLAGCGGDDPATPPTGQTCVLNSECNNPLSCSFGRCHAGCMETRDCPAGQRCVVGDNMVKVCQLPEEKTCRYNTDCIRPLVCARDLQCRNQCLSARDCTKGQICATPDMVCADPAEVDSTGMLKNTIDGSVPPPPPEAGADGGVPSDGGLPPDGPEGDQGPPVDGGEAGVAPEAGSEGPTGDGPVPDAEVIVEAATALPASVPQGGSAVITVTGANNLAGAGQFALGDLLVTLQAGATPAMFKLNVLVPHGVTLGPKTLTFTTASGYARKENILTVTGITAGPTGNDTTGNGSADAPFRTFKRALQVATASDTVRLLDGEYRMADGETWMVPIPDKVTVEGQSAAGTKLIGPGETGGSVSVDGVFFNGDATVKNLSVTGFRYGVEVAKPGINVTLENVKSIASRSYGLYIQGMGAKVTLSGMENDFSKNQSTGIYIYGPMVTLSGTGAGTIGSLTSGYGMQISGAGATVNLTGYTFLAGPGGNAAIYAGPASALKFDRVTFQDQLVVYDAMSTLELIDSNITIAPTITYAVDFRGSRLIMRGTTVSGSRYGVHQSNNTSEATIRGCTFKSYVDFGYYIQSGKLDLGTMTEAGNNVFMGPDTGAWGLYDYRQLAATPITCSNTTFNGFRPPAGKVTATAGVRDEPGKYRIQTTGNSIDFFEL